MIVSFVIKQDLDFDEDMIVVEIFRCFLLMQFFLEDSLRILIKVYQVVYDVFKSYFFGKYGNVKVLMFILLYIEMFFMFVEYDLGQFDLEFYFVFQMMVFYLKLFSSYLEIMFILVFDIISDIKYLL